MLRNYVLDNWRLFFDTEKPSDIFVVPLSSCSDEYGNDLVLIFINGKNDPSYVLKATRNKQYGFKIRREYAALEILYLDKLLSEYIPKPYFIGARGECPFFFQAGISGVSLQKMLRVKGFSNKCNMSLLGQAVDLLAMVNQGNGTGKEVLGEVCNGQEIFSDKKILKRFESANIPVDKLNEIKTYFLTFDKSNTSFFVHGDYWPANIIVNSSTNIIQGIIDWEFCSPAASIPFDIIWFLFTLVRDIYRYDVNSKGTILDAFKWGFYKSNKNNELISSLYNRYASQMTFECEQFSLLLKSVLTIASVRELKAYGESYKMDNIYLELLQYAVQQDKCIYD